MYLEKNMVQKDICTPMFTEALFKIAKIWKQLKCPSTDEWIKMWHMYTMGCYLAIIKNELILFTAIWMNWKLSY